MIITYYNTTATSFVYIMHSCKIHVFVLHVYMLLFIYPLFTCHCLHSTVYMSLFTHLLTCHCYCQCLPALVVIYMPLFILVYTPLIHVIVWTLFLHAIVYMPLSTWHCLHICHNFYTQLFTCHYISMSLLNFPVSFLYLALFVIITFN